MNYREKMREHLKEPNEICNHYGKWGILNKEQRDLITRLLNEMDGADNYIKKLQQENTQLKENNMSMQEEMARTWEKADLYKEVIEEVRKYTKKEIREYKYAIDETTMDSDTEDIYDMAIRNFEKLLQILDKVKD